MEGNVKHKFFGVENNASLIGIDEDNNFVKFGKINNDFYFDYREDDSKINFFQRNLDLSDICEKTIFQPVYYNVIYKYKCNYDLKRNQPILNISTGRCKIEIEIYAKEACKYIKLSYDNYYIKYKFIIIAYLALYVIMLIIPKESLTYTVSNSFIINIIIFTILLNFPVNEVIIIIPFILSIFISIITISFLNENFPLLNRIILLSVSGFCHGDIIKEIIFSYFKILNNFEIWIIIILFTIAFNILLVLPKKITYILCVYTLLSYIISNLYIIWISKKLPIWTIVYSLKDQGFNMDIMENFIYHKYYLYFSIYFISFIGMILLRFLILLKFPFLLDDHLQSKDNYFQDSTVIRENSNLVINEENKI